MKKLLLTKSAQNINVGRANLWRTDFKKNWSLYLLGLPVVAFYLIFHYLPMYGVVIAFQDFNIKGGEDFFGSILSSDWVGFEHFKDFFSSYYFLQILKNTLVISITTFAVTFPFPIILALLMNEIKNQKFASTVKTISYLPHFISLVVVCGMLRSFVAQGGAITQFLGLFGVEDKNLLNNPSLFVPIYVISGVWQTAGWDSIIYVAALAGIDMSLYEAAQIDGANRWKQTLHITIPGLLPTIILLMIMKVGSLLNVGYEKIILLYNPVTYETADVISSFTYRRGLIDGDWSYSAAVGMFSSVVNLILLVSVNAISRRVSETSLW